MTTVTKTETNTEAKKEETNNQAVFAPLGKYAAIAVIMVGIIVTTAIMLDKQLNKAEAEIASIEEEIANQNNVQAQVTETSNLESNAGKPLNEAQVATDETIATPITTNSTSAEVAENEVAINAVIEDNRMEDNNLENTSQENTSQENNNLANNQQDVTATAKMNSNSYQAHTESYKARKKTRMAEMFDRIKDLESKQLEQYKALQDEQVARLRNKVATQQQIDSLIQRNENLYNLRSANIQRNRVQREQTLNRI